MNIVKATHRFEEWLGHHTRLVKPDLRLKHERTAEAVFPFLRATFYRWMQIWPEVCPDLAKAPHFLLAFSLTVLVGLRFMGGLLAGSLIIIPAATGRRLGSSNISGFLLTSCAASLGAVGIGFLLNNHVLHAPSSGPIILMTSAVIFGLSLLKPTQ